MRQSKDPKYLRLELVKAAKQHGIKPAARMFGTTVKTVRKWLRRYEQAAYNGLRDNSRAPKHPHRPVSPSEVQRLIDLKRRLPSFGAERIKRDFELTLSVKAIRRVWKQEGLMRVKRRKHRTKNDLRAVKASWRVFEQLEIDVKFLKRPPHDRTGPKNIRTLTVRADSDGVGFPPRVAVSRESDNVLDNDRPQTIQ